MSQEQYNTLLSNLLREKCTLTKLRVELEGRKGKLYRSCKGFGHLVRNCRNRRREEKGAEMPQNKFEVLRSQVMQCGVKERVIRNIRMEAIRYFKCGEEGHKCRWCPLWKKMKRMACLAEEKAYQGDKGKLTHLKRGKAQERKLRRVEEEKAACPMKGKAQQEECKRSSWEILRKRAEWYCGPTVPQDAEL